MKSINNSKQPKQGYQYTLLFYGVLATTILHYIYIANIYNVGNSYSIGLVGGIMAVAVCIVVIIKLAGWYKKLLVILLTLINLYILGWTIFMLTFNM